MSNPKRMRKGLRSWASSLLGLRSRQRIPAHENRTREESTAPRARGPYRKPGSVAPAPPEAEETFESELVSINAKGILVRSCSPHRRIPYEQIASVHHAPPDEGHAAFRVSIRLVGGEVVELVTRERPRRGWRDASGSSTSSSDPHGSTLVSEIRERWFACHRRLQGAARRAEAERALLPGALGAPRALQRSRETIDRPPTGTGVRQFDLPATPVGALIRNRLGRLGVSLVLGVLTVIVFLRDGAFRGETLGLGVAALVYAGISMALKSSWGAKKCIVLGVDGVLVSRKFISYSNIEEVHHSPAGRCGDAVKWIVALRLVDGPMLELGTRLAFEGDREPEGAELSGEIMAAVAAWRAAQK